MPTPAWYFRGALLLATTYAIVGALALQLAIPPGYVAPLFPSAGIALGAVLLWGPRMLPGVWLGSALIQGLASWNSGHGELAWFSIAILPFGATLQAWYGALLARRFVGFPNVLDTPGHILKFLFIVAPVGCLVSASIAVPTLTWIGALTVPDVFFSWLNWWVGDTIGVLIMTPLMFVFFAQPEEAWRHRRLTVALPLAVALGLIGAAYLQLTRWEESRIQTRFEIDASNLSSLIRVRFNDHLDALQAVERLMATSESVDRATFRHFTDPWFSRFPGIQVLGWAPRVLEENRASFETRVGKSDRPAFRITDRDVVGRSFPAAPAEEYLPILFIEPEATNHAALGLNPWSFAPSRKPLEMTRKSGLPSATEPIRLIQEVGNQRGVVVYQGVFGPNLDFIGMVYGALRMDDAVNATLSRLQDGKIELCLSDTAAPPGNAYLVGTADCTRADWSAKQVAWREDFEFAGRPWRLAFRATPAYLMQQRGWATWTMLAVALLSVGLLGAFLLIITGRARLVESLITRRTTELQTASQELEAQRTSLAQAQRLAHLGSWETLLPDGPTTWSDEMYRILGRPTGETVDSETLIGHLHPDDQNALRSALDNARVGRLTPPLDCRVTVPNRPGEEIFVRLSIASTQARQQPARIRGAIQDITETKRSEARIQRLAHHDTLTGLPNRAHLMNRAMQVLAQARRHGHSAALLFLDLDRFKTINDSLGHPVGDRFLMAAAARLRNCLREEDVIGRLGGDEFVVLLPQLDLPDDAAGVARKIIETLSRPFQIDKHEVTVTASIGIASYPRDGKDIEALLRNADTAMYSAKDAGRNTFQFYASEMNDRALERLILESNLRRAIERGELCLHYQPQIRLPGEKIAGVEALVRWNHPELGLIAPARFIPIAEESSLIVPLGDWVLREACRQQLAWRELGLRPVPIAVNISALQFRRPDFVETVKSIVAEMGADPAMLELEVTESTLMQPTESIFLQLEALRQVGFALALDDFGTGYSSLAYLKRLPINRLKIDRSFVQDLPGDAEDAAVASATLSMARDLGLEVVAEGVETVEQRDFLFARGCTLMQGFLYARPMPADEMTERLRS